MEIDRLRKLSDPEIQERLGFRQTTIRKMIHDGQLQAVVVRGRLRLTDSGVQAFIDKAKRGEVA